MKKIYGAIGYTVYNSPNNKKIIIFSDKHDNINSCNDSTIISQWMNNKMYTSKVLLEEIPNIFPNLELFPNSFHTKALKNLFINNQKIIDPMDIRPFLIPFNWELTEKDDNTRLWEYLSNIDLFYSLKHPQIYNNLLNYRINKLKNTNLGSHFLESKKIYRKFLETYKKYLYKTINEIIQIEKNNNNINLLSDMMDIVDQVMEWYICAKIMDYQNKNIILHAGLAHTEKIIYWLENFYGYKKVYQTGVNNMKDTSEDIDGCQDISDEIDSLF
jgi:hypothetical protein